MILTGYVVVATEDSGVVFSRVFLTKRCALAWASSRGISSPELAEIEVDLDLSLTELIGALTKNSVEE